MIDADTNANADAANRRQRRPLLAQGSTR